MIGEINCEIVRLNTYIEADYKLITLTLFTDGRRIWQCVNKQSHNSNRCLARVILHGGNFTRGLHVHEHAVRETPEAAAARIKLQQVNRPHFLYILAKPTAKT